MVFNSGRPIRRVTRNRLKSTSEKEEENDDDNDAEMDEEDTPIGRRSTRTANKKSRDEISISSEPIIGRDGIRRSSRNLSKSVKRDSSSEEEEESDKDERKSGKYIHIYNFDA